jgi:hypothetical protein
VELRCDPRPEVYTLPSEPVQKRLCPAPTERAVAPRLPEPPEGRVARTAFAWSVRVTDAPPILCSRSAGRELWIANWSPPAGFAKDLQECGQAVASEAPPADCTQRPEHKKRGWARVRCQTLRWPAARGFKRLN